MLVVSSGDMAYLCPLAPNSVLQQPLCCAAILCEDKKAFFLTLERTHGACLKRHLRLDMDLQIKKNEPWVFYSLSYPGSLNHKPTSHSWLCNVVRTCSYFHTHGITHLHTV